MINDETEKDILAYIKSKNFVQELASELRNNANHENYIRNKINQKFDQIIDNCETVKSEINSIRNSYDHSYNLQSPVRKKTHDSIEKLETNAGDSRHMTSEAVNTDSSQNEIQVQNQNELHKITNDIKQPAEDIFACKTNSTNTWQDNSVSIDNYLNEKDSYIVKNQTIKTDLINQHIYPSINNQPTNQADQDIWPDNLNGTESDFSDMKCSEFQTNYSLVKQLDYFLNNNKSEFFSVYSSDEILQLIMSTNKEKDKWNEFRQRLDYFLSTAIWFNKARINEIHTNKNNRDRDFLQAKMNRLLQTNKNFDNLNGRFTQRNHDLDDQALRTSINFNVKRTSTSTNWGNNNQNQQTYACIKGSNFSNLNKVCKGTVRNWYHLRPDQTGIHNTSVSPMTRGTTAGHNINSNRMNGEVNSQKIQKRLSDQVEKRGSGNHVWYRPDNSVNRKAACDELAILQKKLAFVERLAPKDEAQAKEFRHYDESNKQNSNILAKEKFDVLGKDKNKRFNKRILQQTRQSMDYSPMRKTDTKFAKLGSLVSYDCSPNKGDYISIYPSLSNSTDNFVNNKDGLRNSNHI